LYQNSSAFVGGIMYFDINLLASVWMLIAGVITLSGAWVAYSYTKSKVEKKP
jgi:hypothetical protein